MSGPPSGGSRLRWTTQAYLVVGGGVALIVAGVAARTSAPIFVGLPLLFAPFLAALVAPPPPRRTVLAWGATGAESRVAIAGTVRTEPPVDPGSVEVAFRRPADLAEGRPVTFVRAAGRVDFRLDWVAPYPTIARVDPPRVAWRDGFGLVERELPTTVAPLVVERYPSELIRLGRVRLDRVRGLPGETRSRRIGSAGEFFAIRDATPSDPPRRINWRATARFGRRLVNEYELDRTGDVLLLIDARPARLGPAVDEVLLSASRAAAIGIAEALARWKNRLGYAAYGEFLNATPLSSGRGHALRLREAIRTTRRSAVGGPSERCAATLPRFFAPGVTTILISPLTGDAEPALVPFVRRRGYPTLVLSPSPALVPAGGPRLAPDDEAVVTRLERATRRSDLAQVWKYAPVADWSERWSLAAFVRLLGEPARRRSS